MTRFQLILSLTAAALMAGCASMPPDYSLLDNARSAIGQAADAGASEYSPLELRFAREKLEAAELALSDDQGDLARRLADESEIEAQLALARTRAAQARADLAQRQRELDSLRADLAEAFGDEVLE
jgi:hypothetical protein